MSKRTQVLIAVDPPLFGTALATVVRSWPLGVLVWSGGTEVVECDIAVVTGGVPAGVEARSVISLPELESNPVVGLQMSGGHWQSFELSGIDDLFGAIRAAVPA